MYHIMVRDIMTMIFQYAEKTIFIRIVFFGTMIFLPVMVSIFLKMFKGKLKKLIVSNKKSNEACND